MKKLACLFGCALLAAACAGRPPAPQQVAFATDADRDCTYLLNEMSANAASARSKIEANRKADEGDVALGVVGTLLFFPAYFAMDTKNADGFEGNALLDRNDHLKRIAMDKKCDVSAVPTVARYQ